MSTANTGLVVRRPRLLERSAEVTLTILLVACGSSDGGTADTREAGGVNGSAGTGATSGMSAADDGGANAGARESAEKGGANAVSRAGSDGVAEVTVVSEPGAAGATPVSTAPEAGSGGATTLSTVQGGATGVIEDAVPVASRTIGREGGRLEVADGPLAGLAVDVPEGSVTDPTEFSVGFGTDPDALPGGTSFPVGAAVTLEPHGVRFAQPVTVTLPLDFSKAGDPDDPVLVLKQDGDREEVYFPPAVEQPEPGLVAIRISDFSTLQPVQRPLDDMLASVLDLATCAGIASLEVLGWRPDAYFFQGGSVNLTSGVQAVGGVDMVFDLLHLQFGTYWYVGLGFYTNLAAAGASVYYGWGMGPRDNIHDAWTGSLLSASADADVGAFLSGYLGAAVGITGFTSCRDVQGDRYEDNQSCDPGELQAPWIDAVFGVAAYGSVSLHLIPEPVFGGLNGGATAGWWTSFREGNNAISRYLGRWGIAHEVVWVPTDPPTQPDTATYIQFKAPNGGRLEASIEMAKAMLVMSIPFTPQLAAIAIVNQMARDAGCNDTLECLRHYCSSTNGTGGAGTGGAGGSGASSPMSTGGALPMATGGLPAVTTGGAPAISTGGAPPMSTGGLPAVTTGGAPPMSTGGSTSVGCDYGSTGNHGDVCTEAAETWRCVYSSVEAVNVSQVCRDGIWQTYHRSPSDCEACCGSYSDACQAGPGDNPDVGDCGYGTTGNHGDVCTEAAETWRCVYSSVQGVNVSQVCRDGIWQTYHRYPSDCKACCGSYSDACAQ
ncbi:MAG: hypothetical protein JXC32_22505 [Anaerolineae bacterium]|nr:hypothetical protein [Anaerolineae bacterium]